MTHAEFLTDIKRARAFVDDRNSTMVLSLAAVDHLIAIHAAAVEFFTAQKAYEDAMNNADEFEAWDGHNCDEPQDRMLAARANLAALCGWEAEETK